MNRLGHIVLTYWKTGMTSCAVVVVHYGIRLTNRAYFTFRPIFTDTTAVSHVQGILVDVVQKGQTSSLNFVHE